MHKVLPSYTTQTDSEAFSYENYFLEDICDLFLGFNSGHLGKYLYDSSIFDESGLRTDIWNEILKTEKDCYVSNADCDLLRKAMPSLLDFYPPETPLIDFGIGSLESIKQKTLPMIKSFGIKEYYAVDFCKKFLSHAHAFLTRARILYPTGIRMDFFADTAKPITDKPSFSTILGGTLANMYSPRHGETVEAALIQNLRRFSKMTNHGWMLVSIDTNQNWRQLIDLYSSRLHGLGHTAPLFRMIQELPVKNFSPYLFDNAPKWRPEEHLIEQTVIATKDQAFTIDNRDFFIRSGQQLHIMNSFKFPAPFFESCCDKAGLDILHVWHHESPMKLYLLVDRKNPFYTAKH